MERLGKIDWPEVRRSLDNKGFAAIPSLLTAGECDSIIKLYDDDRLFRSTINKPHTLAAAAQDLCVTIL